jgi:hypothetical protein
MFISFPIIRLFILFSGASSLNKPSMDDSIDMYLEPIVHSPIQSHGKLFDSYSLGFSFIIYYYSIIIFSSNIISINFK